MAVVVVRVLSAIGIAALALGFASEAYSADLSILAPKQRQTAECLLSTLSLVREVTQPRLTVTDDPSHDVVLQYKYRHRRTGKVEDSGTYDVTGLLTEDEHHVVLLPGLYSPGEDINDSYLRIFQIWDLWQSKCGLRFVAITGGSQTVFTGLADSLPEAPMIGIGAQRH